MANDTHVQILKQGVSIWNKWRMEHPEVLNPDLSWADLRGMDLMWADFRDTDLGWANLSNCNLILANLQNADLTKARLVKADLTKAMFDGAHLYGADLSRAYCYRTSFTGADLSQADLTRANFDTANLTDARLQEVNLSHTRFKNAALDNADFTGADLRSATFENSPIDFTQFTPSASFGRRWAGGAVLLGLLILSVVGYVGWQHLQNEVLIQVPVNAQPVVFWENERLKPSSREGAQYHYHIKGALPGEYRLRVYTTQLANIKERTFVRFKSYHDTVQISNADEPHRIEVPLDTLYSLRWVTRGILPNISPDGRRIVYHKISLAKDGRSVKKSLWMYDIPAQKETEINIQDRRLYDLAWEWDRPYFDARGEKIFQSAFNFQTRKSYAFIIDAGSGTATPIPLEVRKSWLKYLPLKQPAGLLIGNKIYSLDGKYQSSFNFGEPYQDALFYGGENGLVFFKEEKVEGRRSLLLECTYLDLETLQAKVLFEIPKNKPPFISASNDAERVIITRYSGITEEFYSTIQLWSNGYFVNLTNPYLDGKRRYENGLSYHKTEACADSRGENSVFEYEDDIFLLNLPPSVTIGDLVKAELRSDNLSYSGE